MQPRLTKGKIQQLERLLDMLYRPGEIAQEIGITVETLLRSFLPAGAPAIKDDEGKIWFNGKAFAAWGRKQLAKNTPDKERMKDDEAYCFRCRKRVVIVNPKRRRYHRDVDQINGTCPECEGKVYRFGKKVVE